jgi:uncharacterized Fe-S center protein
VKEKGAKPFLCDTNTLYVGERKNAVDHLNIAAKHGFTSEVVGAPIIIADGLTGRNIANVEINKKNFKSVKIAADIVHADSMIVVSHFKCHIMAGFGGAIKNLAMGCAPAEGKKEQHSARPVTDPEKCIGCGTCVKNCPEQTIELVKKKAIIHPEHCIGCGECMINCAQKAIELDWTSEIPQFMERVVEYAYGAIANKKGRVGFINFLTKIVPECDCFTFTDAPIVEDIGILASTDPVALDKACFDLVNKQKGRKDSALTSNWEPGQDKFKGVHENTQGELQFLYGEKIGLGSTKYTLKELKFEAPIDKKATSK